MAPLAARGKKKMEEAYGKVLSARQKLELRYMAVNYCKGGWKLCAEEEKEKGFWCSEAFLLK